VSPHLRQPTQWLHHVVGVLKMSGGRRLAACHAEAGGVAVLATGARARAHCAWLHRAPAGAAGHDARAGPAGRCGFRLGRLGEWAALVLCTSGPLEFRPIGL
jgi:hypothetical protein